MPNFSLPITPIAVALALTSLPFSTVASEVLSDKELAAIQKPVTSYKFTNTSWEQKSRTTFSYQNPYQVSLFSAENGEDKQRLWSQTQSIFGYGVGVAGFIWLLPEEISNWEKEGKVFKKWGDNVTSGPVWDRDVFWINYLGHPYFGGTYYQAARKSGYRQWDSFVYSFLMSTFYWEYGLEAFAEIPSIQDLVVTPVLGWAWGEWAYQTEQDIRRQGGRVMGSETLGAISMAVLDPVDSLGRGINELFGREIIVAGTGYIGVKQVPVQNGDIEQQFQLNVSYQLGNGNNYDALPKYQRYNRATQDPVDTSIIGVTIGTGMVSLDDGWQVDNGAFLETSLGIYFSPSYSLRLNYARGQLDDLTKDHTLTYENYSVSGQYYFNSETNLRPYIALGVGEMMRDQNRDRKTFVTSFGAGIHYKMSDKLALQSELKSYLGTRYDNQDFSLSLALVYRFNRGEWLK